MRRFDGLAVVLFLTVSACREASPIARERLPHTRVVAHDALDGAKRGLYVPPAPVVASECEPGETRSCPRFPASRAGGVPLQPPRMTCRRASGGEWRFDRSDCATPLVIAFDDAPVTFTRSGGAFPIGPYARTEWVSDATPWLARDLDGSGCIESQAELFGPPARGPAGSNGFDTLAALDENQDGRVDVEDPRFRDLVLWSDRDGDRRCTPDEVRTLAEAGVASLDLAYTRPTDIALGSHEGERAAMVYRPPGSSELLRGRVVDVYLAPLEPDQRGARRAR